MKKDQRFRIPRLWSNIELKKYAPSFYGDIVNVSAWQDKDKEGGYYRDYFINAKSYSITNYKAEARGFQGAEHEIFLDLERELSENLLAKYDVVFNHTTLEHIFDINLAFSNLCKLSKDIVIVVVPFLQEMHGEYGDYWRFTPLAVSKLFAKNGLQLLHLKFNKHPNSSVYIFAIASKKPDNWLNVTDFEIELGLGVPKGEMVIGYNAFNSSSILSKFLKKLRVWL
ncbi:MAG: hypothetical protein KF775_04065 [Cyclobacteriaceae bacterium]|nr:hypothetical protein [Cyclobacteriaceae bacterium]